MKLCVYSNCQGQGIKHFINKGHPEFDIRLHQNFRLMLGETAVQPLLDDAGDCDVFIYQPTPEFEGKGGFVPSTDKLQDICPIEAKKISFAYQFNTGFFPIVKHGRWWTGEWWVYMAKQTPENLLNLYDNGMMQPFDCARRFAENLAEQSRREEQCTIKLAPWILQNFQTQHLFLLCNHPASALFVELAKRVLYEIDPALCPVEIPYDGPNDANLPGWHALHPAVKRELGITYDQVPGGDADYYRVLIKELAETRGKL